MNNVHNHLVKVEYIKEESNEKAFDHVDGIVAR